jgi:NAD(P)-dependent dehydrogenase (short-subunit alcohol dehydrogenase family)
MSTAKPVALITGGAKGSGRAIAHNLVSCGWQVAVIALPDSGLRRTFARERHVFVIDGDVRDEETTSVAGTVHR